MTFGPDRAENSSNAARGLVAGLRELIGSLAGPAVENTRHLGRVVTVLHDLPAAATDDIGPRVVGVVMTGHPACRGFGDDVAAVLSCCQQSHAVCVPQQVRGSRDAQRVRASDDNMLGNWVIAFLALLPVLGIVRGSDDRQVDSRVVPCRPRSNSGALLRSTRDRKRTFNCGRELVGSPQRIESGVVVRGGDHRSPGNQARMLSASSRLVAPKTETPCR